MFFWQDDGVLSGSAYLGTSIKICLGVSGNYRLDQGTFILSPRTIPGALVLTVIVAASDTPRPKTSSKAALARVQASFCCTARPDFCLSQS